MSFATLKHFAISTIFLTVFSLSGVVEARSSDSGYYSHRHHHEQCAEIAGVYSTYGFDPYQNARFQGTLVITHVENHVFQFEWMYTSGVVNGTGLYDSEKDVISVTFIDPIDFTYLGTQLFKVDGNTLTSRWVLLGYSLVGTETAVKIH